MKNLDFFVEAVVWIACLVGWAAIVWALMNNVALGIGAVALGVLLSVLISI